MQIKCTLIFTLHYGHFPPVDSESQRWMKRISVPTWAYFIILFNSVYKGVSWNNKVQYKCFFVALGYEKKRKTFFLSPVFTSKVCRIHFSSSQSQHWAGQSLCHEQFLVQGIHTCISSSCVRSLILQHKSYQWRLTYLYMRKSFGCNFRTVYPNCRYGLSINNNSLEWEWSAKS